MVKENHIIEPDADISRQSYKIQEDLAKSRISLSKRFASLEDEIECRILKTVDQVNEKIIGTTDQLSRDLLKPLHILKDRTQAVREKIQTSPYKTLALSTGTGLFCGMILGLRKPPQMQQIVMQKDSSELLPMRVIASAPSPSRSLLSVLVLQYGPQFLSLAFEEFKRRRGVGEMRKKESV